MHTGADYRIYFIVAYDRCLYALLYVCRALHFVEFVGRKVVVIAVSIVVAILSLVMSLLWL